MAFRLTPEQVARHDVVPEWKPWLTSEDDGLLLRGDDTGERTIYLKNTPLEIVLSHDLGELLAAHTANGASSPLSQESLSHLLHDGQVPYPHTIYREIFALTIGDRARIGSDGRRLDVRFSVEFPYAARLSRQDQNPDPARLLDLLAEATARRLERVNGGVLMMSAGKDSVALALALAECGRKDITCVTYASEGDDEHVYARGFCRKLGLTHRTVSLESTGTIARDAIERFFTNTPAPGGDLAQIPTVLLLAEAGMPGGAVVEGTGNDASFGYVPRGKDLAGIRLALGRWRWADFVKPLISPGSQLNYLLRDPVEINWPGLRVRYHETKRMFDGAANTSDRWRRVRRENAGADIIDVRGCLRGRHFEIGSQKQKIDLAARAFDMEGIYPYQDAEVIQFYFNLPEANRYDRKRLVNKRLLRDLLRARLGYDDVALGKRPFRFDGAEFVRRNRSLILEEIHGCDQFSRTGLEFLDRSIEGIDRGQHVWHHVLGLFQFAGWYNHSRFLGGYEAAQAAARR
jgi:asparagine synthetase B (glutamine-hydrolysing)